MKIDVEGAEKLVFRGARETIEHHQPLLLVDRSGGDLGGKTAEFFRVIGYEWNPWLSDAEFAQEAVPRGDLVARSA